MTGSMSKITTVADIPVELIDVMPGRRRLDPTWVETLSDLFSGQGQQTPIELVAAGDLRPATAAAVLAAVKGATLTASAQEPAP